MIDAATLRAWRAARQGLDGSLRGATPAAILEATGWTRSVGGASPYLALFARGGCSRAAIDAAVADGSIGEMPAARGCTYVVPAADAAVALRTGQGHGDDASIAVAAKYCGFTEAERRTLCAAIVKALAGGPLDPAALKTAAGAAVRHLGDEGKKRGMTTTLSLGLGWLQSHGAIRRVPLNGRLDNQRYAYALWDPSPLDAGEPDDLAIATDLARRYFRWAAPATAKAFAAWSGFGVKIARAAAAAAGAEPLADGDDRLLFPADRESLLAFTPPRAAQYALVGSLDNATHLRWTLDDLVDEADTAVRVYGEKARIPLNALQTAMHHLILDRGRLVGFWEFDAEAHEIVYATFVKPSGALRAAVAAMETFVRDDLGDARTFSLDSPASRGDRLAALRAADW